MITTNNNSFIYLNNLISPHIHSTILDIENLNQLNISNENLNQEETTRTEQPRSEIDIQDLLKNPYDYLNTEFINKENHSTILDIAIKNKIKWLIKKCDDFKIANEINETIKNLFKYAKTKNSTQVSNLVMDLYKKKNHLSLGQRIQLVYCSETYQLIDLKLFLTIKNAIISNNTIVLKFPYGNILQDFEKETLRECLSMDNKWHNPEIVFHCYLFGMYLENELNQILIKSKKQLSMIIEEGNSRVNFKKVINKIPIKTLYIGYNFKDINLKTIIELVEENKSLECLNIKFQCQSTITTGDIKNIEEVIEMALRLNNILRDNSSIKNLDLKFKILY